VHARAPAPVSPRFVVVSAQVNGLRGETETLDKMSERVRYDLEYLRHWSPWLDIKIIVKTIGQALWASKNVY
jgi:putative colanic acid biosynthesis UDP-glucose lipid carrier transferase